MTDNPLLQLIGTLQEPARSTKLDVRSAMQMREAGMSNRAIARHFGISHQAVQQKLPPNEPWRHSQETKNRYHAMRDAGMSIRHAAAAMELCRSTVERWEKIRCTT
jgi:predicted transcriptional regulator